MQELQTINNVDISVKEYCGQRVVTFKDIDAVHGRPDGTARRNFNANKSRLVEGEDYFVRNSYEAMNELGVTAPNGLTLIAESGYLMLVKSFTDDLAWNVQRQLVNGYFRAKSIVQQQYGGLSPQLQALINIEMRQNEQERRMNELAVKSEETASRITDVVSAFAVPAFSPDQWQEQANQTINRIVEMNHLNHQKFRHKLYEELERVANCNLKMRQDKLKARMRNGGAKMSEISAVSKLAVIARDAKLRAIFEGILRREAALCLAAC